MKETMIMFWSILVLLQGCSGVQSTSSREVSFSQKQEQQKKMTITAIELQEDIQRFSGVFTDRIIQTIQAEEKNVTNEQWQIMQRQGLLYATSAIDIATGATPEVNLLDMMTFLTLSKEAIREHWIPNVLKEHAEDLLKAFEKSEKEIWEIAAKVSNEEERKYFREIIYEWKKDNPNQYRVESIRLTGLSRTAGNIEEKRSKKISGMLVAIKGASASADQAVLLANRAMFLAQRMPFLIRMHTRIGAKDIIQDTFSQVDEADELMQEMQEFDPMISNLSILTERLESVLKVYRATFPLDPNSTIGHKLSSIERILTKADPITKRLMEVDSEGAENIIKTLREQLERLILITFFSMLFLILAWWGGYYWTKRNIAIRNSTE